MILDYDTTQKTSGQYPEGRSPGNQFCPVSDGVQGLRRDIGPYAPGPRGRCPQRPPPCHRCYRFVTFSLFPCGGILSHTVFFRRKWG